jgi:hypothetical protein
MPITALGIDRKTYLFPVLTEQEMLYNGLKRVKAGGKSEGGTHSRD